MNNVSRGNTRYTMAGSNASKSSKPVNPATTTEEVTMNDVPPAPPAPPAEIDDELPEGDGPAGDGSFSATDRKSLQYWGAQVLHARNYGPIFPTCRRIAEVAFAASEEEAADRAGPRSYTNKKGEKVQVRSITPTEVKAVEWLRRNGPKHLASARIQYAEWMEQDGQKKLDKAKKIANAAGSGSAPAFAPSPRRR